MRLILFWTIGTLPLLAASAGPTQDPPAEGRREESRLDDYRRAALAERGDPDRGRRLFEDSARTRCLLCHAVEGRGGTLGPDLMGAGGRLGRDGLMEAILEPSAKIHPDYVATIVALKSGRVLQGMLRPVGEDEVEIASSETEKIRVPLGEIEERKPSNVSIMPAGLHQTLSPGEMADLIAHLVRLEPAGSAASGEALDPRDIPRAIGPVTFRPIVEAAQAFTRPVWFGPLPGRPAVNVVVEIDRARVWLLEPGPDGLKKSPFVDLGPETTPGELTGVTSIAFHPEFVRNRRYFLKIHTPRSAGRLAVQVVERKAAGDGLRDSGEPSKLLLKIPVFSEIHNGGHLAFGPDGFLYVGMGDTGPQGDPRGHAQDLGVLLGKMLRIDVDRMEGDRPYAIPADNPFRDRPGARPEIWAYGFREPWRFSFDAKTRDLWVGDVGQGQYEEVDIVRLGDNHGWNILEGLRPHSERFRTAQAKYVPPVFAYSHRVGPSVTGGFVYRGEKHPILAGKYIFGDFETRRVWALEAREGKTASIVEIGRSPDRISSFGVDSDGEIYIVGLDRGLIYRIDPSGSDLRPAAAAREVVATSRRSPVLWRHTELKPSESWFESGFDDSSWKLEPGGYGTRGTPGGVIRTTWNTGDIWLRREFELPSLPKGTIALSVHHDEDAEIYINGVLAARLSGFGRDYDEIPILPDALGAIRPGRNVLAVHCRQVGGGQYIDVGIVEVQPGRP